MDWVILISKLYRSHSNVSLAIDWFRSSAFWTITFHKRTFENCPSLKSIFHVHVFMWNVIIIVKTLSKLISLSIVNESKERSLCVCSTVHNVWLGGRMSAVDSCDHHEGTAHGGGELRARLARTDGHSLHLRRAHLRLQSARATLSRKVRHLGTSLFVFFVAVLFIAIVLFITIWFFLLLWFFSFYCYGLPSP